MCVFVVCVPLCLSVLLLWTVSPCLNKEEVFTELNLVEFKIEMTLNKNTKSYSALVAFFCGLMIRLIVCFCR